MRDLDGRWHTPAQPVGEAAVHVLVFTSCDCPIANAYAPTLRQLAAQFASDPVELFLVHCDAEQPLAALRQHAADYELPGTILTDPPQALASSLGVRRTPEAVVLDRSGLRYRGRIDNQWLALGSRAPKASEHDLAAAIDATLRGKPVAQPFPDAVGCMLPTPAEPAPRTVRQPPNILFVLADDLGFGDVSCCNEAAAWRTPNIDRLAREGANFVDAHSGSSVCTPTRYGVLTGRYAWRSRLARGVLGGGSKHLIPKDRATIAHLLRGRGYHTACIGKWHLGMDFARTEDDQIDFDGAVTNGPDICGFDHYYCHNGSLDMAPYVYVEDGRITAKPDRVTVNKGKGFWRRGQTGADFVHEDVLPNLQRRAVNYITQRAGRGDAGGGDTGNDAAQPFFLYLPLPAPHTPILPTAEFRGKSGTNAYGDFVLQVDALLGALLEALEEAGVADNTLVVFTSDNGCSPQADFAELREFGHAPSGPHRGHKADIFEGGHRVPFVARWPEHIARGVTSRRLVCLTDMMRTVADITGATLADNAGEDSISWYPAVQVGANEAASEESNIAPRSAVVHHSINGSFAIRDGDWKLILCPGSGGWSSPKPKPARKQRLPLRQLYNLAKDPAEQINRQADEPEVAERLEQLLQSYVDRGRSTPGAACKNDRDVRFRPTPY
ncbi:MAG: sulfatase-like hydrolase/transferase [Planctomycetota bacterium]